MSNSCDGTDQTVLEFNFPIVEGWYKSCCFNMSNKFWLKSPVEGRRLLWLMALVFAMVFIVQYFELPYGNAFLSLLSVGKAKVASSDNLSFGNSSSRFQIGNSSDIRNLTFSDGLNVTSPSTVDDMDNVSEFSDGKDANEKHSDDNSDNTDPEDNESPSKDFVEFNDNQITENVGKDGHTLAPENAREYDYPAPTPTPVATPARNNVPLVAPTSAEVKIEDGRISNSSVSVQPVDLSTPSTSPPGSNTNLGTPVLLIPNATSVSRDATKTVEENENSGLTKTDIPPLINYPLDVQFPKMKESSIWGAGVSISEMNDWLLYSRTSPHSMKPRWSSSAGEKLPSVKSLIENAPNVQDDPDLYAPLFRNISIFKRSYELMEQTLKVYIYKEGKRPIYHTPILKGIYASEGWFMKLMKTSKQFVTRNPKNAHLFYLPFSSRMLEETLYVPNSHDRRNLIQNLTDYLNLITTRYPFWNRTDGADHFLVACHDWAPSETKKIMGNCIRALCNADVKESFTLGKDVSLPETYVRSPKDPLRELGGKPPSKRKILAFFAGNMHGYLRPILLKYWENKDPDMRIFAKMPKLKKGTKANKGQMNYIQHMQSSKYCICAKGYEVNSPRVVEAIFYDCVPVIISDNFVPPFFETLNWESFAVFVMEKDIPNLKNILLSIPRKKYLQMQKRVKLVQKHFLWHPKPVKYDIFHMILHSIWFNRVFRI